MERFDDIDGGVAAGAVRDRARYGLTLLLALALVLWTIAGPESSLRSYLVVLDLLGASLLVASLASARRRRPRNVIIVIGVVALTASTIGTAFGSDRFAELTSAIMLLLVAAYVPYIVGVGLARRRRIDAQLVMGAITIYLVIGIAAAMGLSIVGSLQDAPLLLNQGVATDGSFRDKVYFSFVTMATVGYGDFTPSSGSARAVAIFTALAGQLYLIIAVATAVSMFASTRLPRGDDT